MTDRQPTNATGSDSVSRRTVVKTAAMATGLLAGVGFSDTVTAQQTTFRLGGRIAGWQGRSPSSIQGQTNPTLSLMPGKTYKIVWENLDGTPHNVVIEDANGNNLVRTKIITEQGATQSVTFTASKQMAEYYCEVHPQSMRGSVNVSGAGAGGTPTPTPSPSPSPTPTDTPTETATPSKTPTATPNKTADGPLMADDACPENASDQRDNTCAEDGRTDVDFEQLRQLLNRLLRRLFGGQ